MEDCCASMQIDKTSLRQVKTRMKYKLQYCAFNKGKVTVIYTSSLSPGELINTANLLWSLRFSLSLYTLNECPSPISSGANAFIGSGTRA